MLLDNFSLAGRAWGGGMARAADAAAGAASAAKGGERKKRRKKRFESESYPRKGKRKQVTVQEEKMNASCATKGNDELPVVRATDATAVIIAASDAGRAEDGTPSAVSLRFFSFCQYLEKQERGIMTKMSV